MVLSCILADFTMSDFISNLSKDNQLIKHTATVHISNTLTLTARKTANVLLKNAFKELTTQEVHKIKLSDLMEAIGLGKSHNYKPLLDALDELAETTIKWNLFKKDRQVDWQTKQFTMSKLVASVHYEENNGYCEYSYSYHLRELFKSPNIYAKIDLLVQRNFKSKHALALWEFLVEVICSGSVISDNLSTRWLSVEDYRRFLGLQDDEYTQFKFLNQFVLKPSLAEINKVSDIEAKVFYKREVRKVIALRFEIKRKAGFQTSLSLENGNISNEKYEEIQQILMSEYCLSYSKASKLLERYPIEQIEKNLEYVAQEKKSGAVRKIASFTVSAIENDYQIKKSKSDLIAIERGKAMQEILILKEKIKIFEKNFGDYLFEVVREEYHKMNDEDKEEIIEKTKEKNPFFIKAIERDGVESYGVEIMILSTLKDIIFNTEDAIKKAFISYQKQENFDIEDAKKEILNLEKKLDKIKVDK